MLNDNKVKFRKCSVKTFREMNLEYNSANNTWDSGGSLEQSKCKQCMSAKYKTMTISLILLGLAICVCLFGFLVFSEASETPHTNIKTIKFASIIFRHGARTPTSSYNSDPYKNYKWPGGLGVLTNKGKLQLYTLGQKLRKHYAGFLPDEYLDADIYFVSSDASRTLSSAYTLLAGLYPPIPKQRWNSQLAWQPVPVHSIPRYMDEKLAIKRKCKVADDEYLRVKNLSEIVDKYQDLFNNLTLYCNQTMQDVLSVELLYSALLVEKENGLTLPVWTKNFFPNPMAEATCTSFQVFSYNQILKKLRGGPLLSEIITNMKLKHKGQLKPDRKMFLYSGHDLTVVTLWRTLGFEECLLPHYGATLIFELHSVPESIESEVKLVFYNSSSHEPYSLKIPNCEEPCFLEQFQNVTSNVIPGNWDQECNQTS